LRNGAKTVADKAIEPYVNGNDAWFNRLAGV
jgi:hypothetical protein